MAKFNNLGEVVSGKVGEASSVSASAGTGDWLGRLHNSILAFRDVIKMAKEFQSVKDEVSQEVVIKDLPDYPPAKPVLSAASNPALGKFLAEYGDTTIDEALKILKPMTIKQLISMVQHGTRPRQ